MLVLELFFKDSEGHHDTDGDEDDNDAAPLK